MPSETSIGRTRSYIASVELPPAPRSRATETPEVDVSSAPAIAVGQNLVEFADGADPALRPAVTDALLLAQLAADKAGATSPDEWYEAHREVLGHLGFRSADLTRTAQDFSTTDADLHEAILPVITAAFAGAAIPAIILETLTQLSAASQDRPWIRLFERESQRFEARQFQVTMVDGDGESVTVGMLGFTLGIDRSTTQVLFLRHATETAAVERLEGRFDAAGATLAGIAPDLAAKLAERRHTYLANLEI